MAYFYYAFFLCLKINTILFALLRCIFDYEFLSVRDKSFKLKIHDFANTLYLEVQVIYYYWSDIIEFYTLLIHASIAFYL